jgi:glycosyltransferase involved in cell wall biosynthesis
LDKPLVSIIIPTHKGDKVINQCVEAFKQSSYKNVEIIVVDEGLERSAQRNIGIGRATGKYIMYLDSDQLVSSRLIDECVELMDCGFNAIYIPEIIMTKGFFGYLRSWERGFYTGTAVDCVRFFRRSNCPLFDESMTGPEDSDHDRRVNGLRAVSRNVLYHHDNIGFIQYLKKKSYYSKSMARFAEKHPNDKVLDFWWRCFGVYTEQGKWKKLLARPDLTICLFGLILIRGVIYKCGS